MRLPAQHSLSSPTYNEDSTHALHGIIGQAPRTYNEDGTHALHGIIGQALRTYNEDGTHVPHGSHIRGILLHWPPGQQQVGHAMSVTVGHVTCCGAWHGSFSKSAI